MASMYGAKAGIVCFARTWAMELARANITANAIVPTAWTQMTASIPIYEPLIARVEAGEPLPAQVRQAHAIGMPEDSAPLVVFLASEAGAEVTGQAIGIGGDRLTMWSHPEEVAAAFQDGGWSPETIARDWAATVGAATQSYGMQLPPLDLEG
jgi:NAD(P)-dependent dehydrogenase (short-subunit alcohol dehydrogenase family)